MFFVFFINVDVRTQFCLLFLFDCLEDTLMVLRGLGRGIYIVLMSIFVSDFCAFGVIIQLLYNSGLRELVYDDINSFLEMFLASFGFGLSCL